MPPALVRITGVNAANWIHRRRSSGVRRSSVDKNPPISLPHMATPLAPADSPSITALARPSKPHEVVGSPPQTMGTNFAVPLHPDRTNLANLLP